TRTVGAWIVAAHDAGLFACLAGSLGGSDFAAARALGADLVGVRGAACVGGRSGRISRARVAELSALARAAPLAAAATLVQRHVQLAQVILGDDVVFHSARKSPPE